MTKKYDVCWVLAGVAGIFFFTLTSVAAESVVVIPLFSVSGDAASSQVVKGQTFSSKKGKNLTGSLEISPFVQTYTDPDYGMTFNFLPLGTFTMGSPNDEPGGPYTNETQHEVTLTSSFYMQKTEVTQEQWKQVVLAAEAAGYLSTGELDAEPSTSAGGSLELPYPVETVSWEDVAIWITALNQLTGRKYALPTEAQWEYAARATTETAWAYSYSYDDTPEGEVVDNTFNPNLAAMGWYVWQSSTSSTVGYGEETKPVARKQPNTWGLHDMHGNVAEWCLDWFGDYDSASVTDPQGPTSGLERVVRGGSFKTQAGVTRSAARGYSSPDDADSSLGFRLVLYPGNE